MQTIEQKIAILKEKFALTLSAEQRYMLLIELGRALPSFPSECILPNYRVLGCQSTLYLASRYEGGLLFFFSDADALISKGLAAILLAVYSGETPTTIVCTPPSFLIDLGVLNSLTPSRSNGLAYIHQRIKEISLNHL
jgi:cysteine desulfuration protein SufE